MGNGSTVNLRCMGRWRAVEGRKVFLGFAEGPSLSGGLGEGKGPAEEGALGGRCLREGSAAAEEGQDEGSADREAEGRKGIPLDGGAEAENGIESLPDVPTPTVEVLPRSGEHRDQLLLSFPVCWSWIHW